MLLLCQYWLHFQLCGLGVSLPQACTCSFSALLTDRHGSNLVHGTKVVPRIWLIHQYILPCPIHAPATHQEENKHERLRIPNLQSSLENHGESSYTHISDTLPHPLPSRNHDVSEISQDIKAYS